MAKPVDVNTIDFTYLLVGWGLCFEDGVIISNDGEFPGKFITKKEAKQAATELSTKIAHIGKVTPCRLLIEVPRG